MSDSFEYDVFLSCVSADSFCSEWAQLESSAFRFCDPLNKERNFPPLRLDDAPVKGSLAQFLHLNWFPTAREAEYAKVLKTRRSPWKQHINGEVRRLFAFAHTLGSCISDPLATDRLLAMVRQAVVPTQPGSAW
jgi:hypothetical protein